MKILLVVNVEVFGLRVLRLKITLLHPHIPRAGLGVSLFFFNWSNIPPCLGVLLDSPDSDLILIVLSAI